MNILVCILNFCDSVFMTLCRYSWATLGIVLLALASRRVCKLSEKDKKKTQESEDCSNEEV